MVRPLCGSSPHHAGLPAQALRAVGSLFTSEGTKLSFFLPPPLFFFFQKKKKGTQRKMAKTKHTKMEDSKYLFPDLFGSHALMSLPVWGFLPSGLSILKQMNIDQHEVCTRISSAISKYGS